MNKFEKNLNDRIIELFEESNWYKDGDLVQLERNKEELIFDLVSELVDEYQMDNDLLSNESDVAFVNGFTVIVKESIDWNYISERVDEDYAMDNEDTEIPEYE